MSEHTSPITDFQCRTCHRWVMSAYRVGDQCRGCTMDLDDEPAEADPTEDVTTALVELLDAVSFMDAEDRAQASLPGNLFEDARIATFADRGLLTRDTGLVMRLADGTEYQITVQRSK